MWTRLLPLLFVFAALGCDRPSEADCQKAVDNINNVLGLASGRNDTAPEVRKCRAQWKKAAVECAMRAKTKEDVDACDGSK